jgi:hypothetical protein
MGAQAPRGVAGADLGAQGGRAWARRPTVGMEGGDFREKRGVAIRGPGGAPGKGCRALSVRDASWQPCRDEVEGIDEAVVGIEVGVDLVGAVQGRYEGGAECDNVIMASRRY